MGTNSNEIKSLILSRKSTLAFSDKEIRKEDLQHMLEAAQWAPSAFNEQPWRFIYASKAENSDAYAKILDLLAPPNQLWSQNAPVLMLVAAKTKYSHNGVDNAHAMYDAGQAVGAMSIQATALGISMHQMAGFDAAKASAVFNFEGEYIPVVIVAIGYAGDTATLPEALQKRAASPRSRKALTELILNEN